MYKVSKKYNNNPRMDYTDKWFKMAIIAAALGLRDERYPFQNDSEYGPCLYICRKSFPYKKTLFGMKVDKYFEEECDRLTDSYCNRSYEIETNDGNIVVARTGELKTRVIQTGDEKYITYDFSVPIRNFDALKKQLIGCAEHAFRGDSYRKLFKMLYIHGAERIILADESGITPVVYSRINSDLRKEKKISFADEGMKNLSTFQLVSALHLFSRQENFPEGFVVNVVFHQKLDIFDGTSDDTVREYDYVVYLKRQEATSPKPTRKLEEW